MTVGCRDEEQGAQLTVVAKLSRLANGRMESEVEADLYYAVGDLCSGRNLGSLGDVSAHRFFAEHMLS